MALVWNDEYTLGIPRIDEQHKQFVETLNQLIEIIDQINKKPDTKNQILDIFGKIDQYATYHFQTEEKYFIEFHYPGAQEHIAAHTQFKEAIAGLKNQYLTDTISASFRLADFLENWLITHLMTMDKKYVECFRSHGL